MRKYNILVFPCGTEIANEIINSLRNHKYFKLVFATSEKVSYCNFITDDINYLPYVWDKDFKLKLNDLVRRYRIDFIIPAHDDVCYELSKMEEEIEADIVGQSYEINKIVRFKDRTYEYFKSYIPVPEVFNYNANFKFPIFVKPKRGQGSYNAVRIDNRSEFQIFFMNKSAEDFVFMEYLPGEEFTIDCFSHKGELLYYGPRKRKKTYRGISTISSVVVEEKLKEEFGKYARIISRKLNMHGIWFFQMKFDKNNRLKLLEIGPRVSGTMALNRVKGVNFVELAIYQKLGYDLKITFNDVDVSLAKALIPKYKHNISYDNLYIDFDDTLVLDERYINTDLIKLIFHAKNLEKKVFLITKNRKLNLAKILHKFRITNIFDDIIHIREDEIKADYMKGRAILIDDSFMERKYAIEKGFYAFGLDNFIVLL